MEETIMNKLKQKLIGVSLLLTTILSIIVLKDSSVAIVTIPMGLAFIH